MDGESQPTGPLTIDDLGFSNVMDDRVFGRSYQISSDVMLPESGNGFSLAASSPLSTRSELELDVTRNSFGEAGINNGSVSLTDGFRNGQGEVSIRRFSTALTSQEGTLTVGSDWSNFQDFLPVENALSGNGLARQGLTGDQISWASAGELGHFNVALESDYELAGPDELISGINADTGDQTFTSPSLVLSWRGSTPDQRGIYGVTALSRELELDGDNGLEDVSETGWGLNLAGGWRFGELFAALSVTLGDSIDSFILGRMGDRDTASAASRYLTPGESININPSINYRLGDTSNLHLSVNLFESESQDTAHGVETLDTIHLGYTWAPWPSTRIGIEFVGKDVEGPGSMEDSNEVNFAASKRF